ncbi:hypothetical protein [Inquilinus sp. Marseille-Q2685]|uniref:hypothetical protein n=1 Tax=Inquilinus sp. Marseille-Q2685 TaxID=2866581 RepID=UPI001CE458A5|nr:hypothetical protein [Inquilinus sp. Marseille-Q2685]
MTDAQRSPIDDIIETVDIESDQPLDQAKVRADLARYARILSTGTELSLPPELDEDTRRDRVRAILLKASYFCMLDTAATDAGSADNQLRIVLGGLDGHEYKGLTRKQEREIRTFIEAAHADGKVTFEETIDFLVLVNRATDDAAPDLPASTLATARFYLEEHGIEPTEARVRALAEAAETTVADTIEEVEEAAA